MDKEENNLKQKNGKFFFQKITNINLNNLHKDQIAEEIIQDSYYSKLYRLQLVLSCAIASLGLLINSIPVVIGAMLISPLLMPIKVFAFSITTGNKHLYFKSLKTLIFSIALSVIISYLISLTIPFTQTTQEIISRSTPTMVDLFIALSSGSIAFLSIGFTRLSETIAGVAMAASLLPPLCVIGIGLEFTNRGIAQGSSLLFLANLVAILIAGIIILYIFGFRAGNKGGKTRSMTSFIMVFFTVILISIPLFKSMQGIASDIKLNYAIKETISSFTKNKINEKIELDNVKYHNISQNKIFVNATLNVPIGTTITNKHKQEITNLLSLSIKKSIDLDLKLVDISSVKIDVIEEQTNEEKLENYITNYIIKNYPQINIIDIKISHHDDYIVFLQLFNQSNIKESDFIKDVENHVNYFFLKKVIFIYQWQKKTNSIDLKDTEKKMFIQNEFYKIFPQSKIEKLEIYSDLIQEERNEIQIEIFFSTSNNQDVTQNLLKILKQSLQQSLSGKIILDAEYIISSKFEA